MSKRHGAILSPGWRLAKVCAISPTYNDSEKICDNCRRFILTSTILNTPGGLTKWWNETGLPNRTHVLDQHTNDLAYAEFQKFFFRLVCLSSVRVVPDPFHTWTQVQGYNYHHMAAGYTKASQGPQSYEDFGDIIKEPHHAYKTLFFNKDQMALLITKKFPFAVFMCDFGSGKDAISIKLFR